MARYRQRFVEVEAFQFEAPSETAALPPDLFATGQGQYRMWNRTHTVTTSVLPGMWVVTYPDGTREALSDKAFREQYEISEGAKRDTDQTGP